jgi:hypothetical protein
MAAMASAILFVSADPADACLCDVSPTGCTTIATAAAVFEATVDRIDTTYPDSTTANADGSVTVTVDSSKWRKTIRLSNTRALRGTAPDELVRVGSDSCEFTFKAGVRYLIATESGPDGRMQVSQCGMTRPIEEATGLLEYVATLSRIDAQPLVWGRAVRVSDLRQQPVVAMPVAGVEVTLIGPKRMSATTDDDGFFMFRGVPLGTYRASSREAASTAPKLSPVVQAQFTLVGGGPLACAELRIETRQ